MQTAIKKYSLIKTLLLAGILSAPLYLIRLEVFGIPTNVSEIILLSSFAIWLIFSDKRHLAEKISANRFLFYAIITLILGTALSLYGQNFSLAGLGILKSWFIVPILFSFALLSEMESKEDCAAMILAVFFSTSIVCAVALFYKLSGIVTFDGRLAAFYGSPNYLAMYVSPGILCGLYIAYTVKKYYNMKFWILSVLTLLDIFILFLTQSYASWAGMMIALFSVFFYFSQSKKRYLVIISSVIFCSFLFLSQLGSPKLSSLLTENPRSSMSSRTMIWKASFLMIQKNPLLGIGSGNFQKDYLSLQPNFPPYLEWAVPEPHNILLAFWLESSLFGLLSFFAILFFSTYPLLKKIATDGKKNAPEIALVGAFFIYILVVGLFDTPYWKNDFSLVFWIFVVLAICAKTLDFNKGATKN